MTQTLAEWQAESEQIKEWERQTGTHRCAECHSGLVVRWNGQAMELACAKDKGHLGIEPYDPRKERIRRLTMQETKALAVRDPQALITEAQAKWPKELTGPQAVDFVQICLAYGFDPLLGELIPFQGRPYITLDARLRRAQRHPAWGGWAELRPATKEEKEGRGYVAEDVVAGVRVIRKGTEQPLVFGRVSREELAKANAFTPLAKDPYAMAEKRAMHKALRQGFADTLGLLTLPGVEEDIVVDRQTGESIEGEAEIFEDTPGSVPGGPQEAQGVPSEAKPVLVGGPEASRPALEKTQGDRARSAATYARLEALFAKGSGLSNYAEIRQRMGKAWKARQERLGLSGPMMEWQCLAWIADIENEQAGK